MLAKILFILAVVLFFGAFIIISNNNIHLNSSENVSKFFGLYWQWVDGLIGNGERIVGNVVKGFGGK